MKIFATSDLHGQLPHHGQFLGADIVLICGDVMPMIDHSVGYQKDWFVRKFAPWFNGIPAKYALLTPGNHDHYFQHGDKDFIRGALDKNRYYLQDSFAEIEGINILGVPWCSNLPRWAFNKEEPELREYLAAKFPVIEKPVDILMLHAGPKIKDYGKSLDCVTSILGEDGLWTRGSPEYGNEALAEFIWRIKPRWSVNGHLHSAEHEIQEINGTKFACVSYLGEDYTPKYPILKFDIFPL